MAILSCSFCKSSGRNRVSVPLRICSLVSLSVSRSLSTIFGYLAGMDTSPLVPRFLSFSLMSMNVCENLGEIKYNHPSSHSEKDDTNQHKFSEKSEGFIANVTAIMSGLFYCNVPRVKTIGIHKNGEDFSTSENQSCLTGEQVLEVIGVAGMIRLIQNAHVVNLLCIWFKGMSGISMDSHDFFFIPTKKLGQIR